jgi:hypothetical protein
MRRSYSRDMMVIFGATIFAMVLAFAAQSHSAEMQVLGASPAPENAAPEMAVSQRLILHDVVLVRGNNLQIDPAAKPVLDYAAQVLRKNPTTLVYLSGKGNRETVRLQSQAVAHYLEGQGISANRLILQKASTSEDGSPGERSNAGVVVLNLTAPECATCTS